VPWGIPARRVVWEESCWALAMDLGWGWSGAVTRHGAGREHGQEARRAARSRGDRHVARSFRPWPCLPRRTLRSLALAVRCRRTPSPTRRPAAAGVMSTTRGQGAYKRRFFENQVI
jgi:hypothetical protein